MLNGVHLSLLLFLVRDTSLKMFAVAVILGNKI